MEMMYYVGIFLVALFALVLGYLCTQAEPGLIVFGEKVEQVRPLATDRMITYYWF